jgi:hypothetical protein
LTQDDQREPANENESESSSAGAGGKAKRAKAKAPRTNAERAMAHIRSAKKDQREVSDPVERARLLLAEANVLALLELADAISGVAIGDSAPGEATAGE